MQKALFRILIGTILTDRVTLRTPGIYQTDRRPTTTTLKRKLRKNFDALLLRTESTILFPEVQGHKAWLQEISHLYVPHLVKVHSNQSSLGTYNCSRGWLVQAHDLFSKTFGARCFGIYTFKFQKSNKMHIRNVI